MGLIADCINDRLSFIKDDCEKKFKKLTGVGFDFATAWDKYQICAQGEYDSYVWDFEKYLNHLTSRDFIKYVKLLCSI